MEKTITKIEAAEKLGVPAYEIADVASSPAGDVVVTTDGVAYIVHENIVKYLRAPGDADKYGDAFPVYEAPADIEMPTVEDLAAIAADVRGRVDLDPSSDEAHQILAAQDLRTGPSQRDLGIVVELDELVTFPPDQIVAYADRHYGIVVDESWSAERMVEEIRTQIGGGQTPTLSPEGPEAAKAQKATDAKKGARG